MVVGPATGLYINSNVLFKCLRRKTSRKRGGVGDDDASIWMVNERYVYYFSLLHIQQDNSDCIFVECFPNFSPFAFIQKKYVEIDELLPPYNTKWCVVFISWKNLSAEYILYVPNWKFLLFFWYSEYMCWAWAPARPYTSIISSSSCFVSYD